jgi:hypothetical protein
MDHTSFYRLISLPEQGRNFILSIGVPFGNSPDHKIIKTKPFAPDKQPLSNIRASQAYEYRLTHTRMNKIYI